MRQRPAFGWPLAYSGHSTCQMARHERACGPLKAGGRRVEWYRYGVTSKVGASDRRVGPVGRAAAEAKTAALGRVFGAGRMDTVVATDSTTTPGSPPCAVAPGS